MEVSFSSAFKRAFKKRIKGNENLELKFWQKLEIFTSDPYDPSLRTHKLSGKLKDLWSFTVD
ncbi:type II toxin-antitoxin system RelE/ParE family toxin [Laspinema palackyanum]|uniref:type II toxin-antitoxin system RelE/ParE family toxin n=1 Tax=Laspinema palackyanum TaxID=3231601 RepID=UPI00345CC55D